MSEKKSIKKTQLTPTQAKVVKAKIKAELADISQAQVAQEVYPNATPASASVMMSRELKNVNVQDQLAESFIKLGLTTDTLTATVTDAISANRVVQIEGDFYETEVPDHSIRLKAAGMAANWMGVGKANEGGTTNLNFINVSGSDKQQFGI